MAYEYDSAQEVVGASGSAVDTAAAAAADTANVRRAAFINYDAALQNYEDRPDMEPLAERRAREVASTFAATDFMRAE